MTSAINTGSINVNYPVPGVNNSSQGFRDNFSGTVNNLNVAAAEITDLQNKVVVKAALNGVPLNNDMANTKISNALVQNFRASTFSLGNNNSGTANIDVTVGDVQTVGVSTNPNTSITLSFLKWAPAGTQSNVQVILTNLTPGSQINLPSTVTLGTNTIEHYVGTGAGGIIYVPANVTQLHYNFSTLDCGNNIEIQSLNRPRQSSQVLSETSLPAPAVSRQGDIRFVPSAPNANTGNFWGYDGTTWLRLNN